MTVHASKGLEAPVVFLVDSNSKSFISSHVPKFRLIKTAQGDVPAWLPGKTLSNALTSADEERLKTLSEEEYRRLLYVGMTRAADRLIVCGYRGVRDNPDSWQAMIARALSLDEEHCSAATFSGPDGEWGGLTWRLPASGASVKRAEAEQHVALEKPALPSDLSRPLPPQKILPRPLSPSGAGVMVDDDADDLIVTSPLFGDKVAGSLALQKGKLVHRMLQMLTEFSDTERETAAHRYAERAARFWPKPEREKLVLSVMSVLSHADLAPVFSARSQSEVSIMGTLALEGQDFAISGRIDRLVETEGRVIIMDYKTNRKPPADAEAVPLAHRAQLAIYREILKPLYPGKAVDCVLVYTETAEVITLPVELMSRSLAELKTK